MNAHGKLVLAATPLGNLGDLTRRVEQALREADLVVAEDTRRTAVLLSHLGISKPVWSFFEGNHYQRTPQIIEQVRLGKTVVMVTDAGSPTVSDPGFELVRACLIEELPLEALPGPCAAIMALQLSGLPPDRFIFDGFLPRKGKARHERLALYRQVGGSLILYESPHRLVETLEDLLAELGDVSCAVLREMTKLHEEQVRGPLSHVISRFENRQVLGEVTIVVRLPEPEHPELAGAIAGARRLMREMGFKTKDASTAVALLTGADKKALYQALTEEKSE